MFSKSDINQLVLWNIWCLEIRMTDRQYRQSIKHILLPIKNILSNLLCAEIMRSSSRSEIKPWLWTYLESCSITSKGHRCKGFLKPFKSAVSCRNTSLFVWWMWKWARTPVLLITTLLFRRTVRVKLICT